jgi:hypothetical protein
MTLEAIISDQSENMSGSLEHRMCGPEPVVEKQFANVVPLAAFRAEMEAAGCGTLK